jgi:hypothetical protein
MHTLLLPVLAALLSFLTVEGLTVKLNTTQSAGTPPLLGLGWEMWVMFSYYKDMTDPAFIKAFSGLAGTRVRVGGITADFTRYAMDVSEVPEVPLLSLEASPTDPFWPTSPQNITAGQLSLLLNFFSACGMTAVFDLNELYGRNCSTRSPVNCYTMDQWCSGPWDTSNVEGFLRYLHSHALVGPSSTLTAFELGNELACHLDPATNIADISTLAALIQSIWADVPQAHRPGLFAPSTDVCSPSQLEILGNLSSIPGVSGFSFHSYPGGDGVYPPLSEVLLNETWLRSRLIPQGGAASCIEAWRAGPQRQGLALWVTESSSSYSTTVPAPAQNSFLNGFFSLAEWGQYSFTGVSYLARWALSESSPFATVARNASRPGWDASHDYFLLRAWKALVGDVALGVAGDAGSGVLVYAYCALGKGGAVVVTAANLLEQPQPLALVQGVAGGSTIDTEPRMEWVFTAPQGNLSSTTPLLNGGPGVLRLGEDGAPPEMPGKEVAVGGGGIVLPPLSQSFFLLPQAGAAICV